MIGEIAAQAGPQSLFLETPADIAIFGGSAGGGKSFALLLDLIRYVHNPLFGAVLFRRTTPQIKNEGGLWDESEMLYPKVGATGYRHALEWRFPSGAKVKMAHMEHEKNRFDWMGAQIGYIGFDEITHFSAKQFWYLTSRNRSNSGEPALIRGTCNPDADSWVKQFIAWWLDKDTGYAIEERSGVVRYFVRIGDDLDWADTREELIAKHGPEFQPKSATFIRASIYDNKIFLGMNPGYLSTLKSLPLIDREILLKGNWKIRAAAGLFYKREWFEIVDAAPADILCRVRFWDRAASTPAKGKKDPDWTKGVLLSKARNGVYYIEDVRGMQESAHAVERAMINTAGQDGTDTAVCYNQDPGSAGKGEAEATARALEGFNVHFWPTTGDKTTRAKPASAQAEAGNIKVVRAGWNDDFLTELENFPEGGHDDGVDGLSGAFEWIASAREILVA